jgi:hypothetical protein
MQAQASKGRNGAGRQTEHRAIPYARLGVQASKDYLTG